MPKRTVDRVILAAMLVLIAAGGFGAWRLFGWVEATSAKAQVQAYFDKRTPGAVAVDSCTSEKLDAIVDFHTCVIRTADVEVLADYGVPSRLAGAATKVCFSLSRTAGPFWRSDRDPVPENDPGSHGDCHDRL